MNDTPIVDFSGNHLFATTMITSLITTLIEAGAIEASALREQIDTALIKSEEVRQDDSAFARATARCRSLTEGMITALDVAAQNAQRSGALPLSTNVIALEGRVIALEALLSVLSRAWVASGGADQVKILEWIGLAMTKICEQAIEIDTPEGHAKTRLAIDYLTEASQNLAKPEAHSDESRQQPTFADRLAEHKDAVIAIIRAAQRSGHLD